MGSSLMESDGSAAELDGTDTSAATSGTCIDEWGSWVDEDVMVQLAVLLILRAERSESARDARLNGNTEGTAPSFSFFLSPGKDSHTGIQSFEVTTTSDLTQELFTAANYMYYANENRNNPSEMSQKLPQ